MAEEGKERPTVNEENQNIHLYKNFLSLHLFSNEKKNCGIKKQQQVLLSYSAGQNYSVNLSHFNV